MFTLPDEVLTASFISSCVIRGSSLISDFALTYSNGCYRATVKLVVFKRLLSTLKFSAAFDHSGSCRRQLPKTDDQTRKDILMRLAAKKMISNHCTQVTIGNSIHAERMGAVILTRHISFWSNIGPPDLVWICILVMMKFAISMTS